MSTYVAKRLTTEVAVYSYTSRPDSAVQLLNHSSEGRAKKSFCTPETNNTSRAASPTLGLKKMRRLKRRRPAPPAHPRYSLLLGSRGAEPLRLRSAGPFRRCWSSRQHLGQFTIIFGACASVPENVFPATRPHVFNQSHLLHQG